MQNHVLRQKLQELTENTTVEEHPRLLNEVSSEIAHSIRILDSEFSTDSYTCFPYAFDLVDDPDYIEISKLGSGRVYANSEFVAYLLEHGSLTEICSDDVNTNDIVLYFVRSQPVHSGKALTNKRVISKWGIGYLYEHDLLDAPESYGDEIQFYKGVSKETATWLFLDYAEFQGIIQRQ